MRSPILLVLAASLGCSVAGSASGECRVRYAARSPAPLFPGGERSEPAVVTITERGAGELGVSVAGCELVATPIEARRRYRFTAGSCTTDVPTLGPQTFEVRHRAPDGSVTEDSGEEAFMNLADPEVFLQFEARVGGRGGVVDVRCEATRRR